MDMNTFALRDAVRYEPNTGKFYWRWRYDKSESVNRQFAGQEAFTTVKPNGTLIGTFNGKGILAHNAAWYMHWGDWPDGRVVHLNGNPWDNRIENLELGAKLRADNKSGHAGVYWNKHAEQWMAYITIKGGMKYLGRFDDIEDAIAARKAAE